MGPLDVVPKGEEGITAQGHAGHAGEPLPALLPGELLGLLGEELLPGAIPEHIHALVADVDVDRVVPVGPADARLKGQLQHLGALAQVPVVGLVAGQAGAVDAALLAGPHADGLAVLHIAHRVGLGVLQRDEGDNQIPLGLGGESLVLGGQVFQQAFVDFQLIAALLEGDAEHVLVLDGGGLVSRVNLHHIVAALALLLQDGQGLVGVARGDNAVGDLPL